MEQNGRERETDGLTEPERGRGRQNRDLLCNLLRQNLPSDDEVFEVAGLVASDPLHVDSAAGPHVITHAVL